MKRNIITSFLLGFLGLFFFTPQKAQDIVWPQFRGINCSGIADNNQDPPISFGNDQNMIWNTNLSTGESSPCIWQDNIFITGFEEEDKLLIIYCIDRISGAIRWQKEISVKEFEKVHAVSSPANATPATDGERVVFYFGSYGLLCYDLDGELQWELPMPLPKSQYGMGTSPILTDELVILNCFGHENDPCLLAINKYDGKIIWKHSSPVQENESVDSYSTPVIYKDQIIIYRSKDIAAYDSKTGDLIWKYITGFADAICTPVIGNDMLYLTSFSTLGNPKLLEQFPDFKELATQYDKNQDNLITKEEAKGVEFIIYPEKGDLVSNSFTIPEYFGFWDKNADTFIDSVEWISTRQFCESFYESQGIKAIKLGGEGDIGLDYFLWGYSDHVPHVTSPLYYDNRVYMVKSGGILTCFHAESGELLFQERLGAPGAYFSSPVAVNNKIYIASRNGIVTVIEAGDKLSILAKNDLDDKIAATPAIVDNKIYLRTANALYAFGN